MRKERKKTWDEKVELVQNSFMRSKIDPDFATDFYRNLFFLKPKIAKYFDNTDFDHQNKALLNGLEILMGFFDDKNVHARKQVQRISQTHSKQNLNIHPHDYYYWIEALVMTVKEHDHMWFQELEYYWREVISFPVTYMISQYFSSNQD